MPATVGFISMMNFPDKTTVTNAAAAPSFDDWRRGLLSRSAEETAALAAHLAKLLPPDTVLALHGDLGAGKTTFARAFARVLGVRENVTSPTFAIFNIYETPARQLVHMDAYRLPCPAAADALLLWDLLRPPWTLLVEWPENLGDRLPPAAWHLHFLHQPVDVGVGISAAAGATVVTSADSAETFRLLRLNAAPTAPPRTV